jgi:hypothetical protein
MPIHCAETQSLVTPSPPPALEPCAEPLLRRRLERISESLQALHTLLGPPTSAGSGTDRSGECLQGMALPHSPTGGSWPGEAVVCACLASAAGSCASKTLDPDVSAGALCAHAESPEAAARLARVRSPSAVQMREQDLGLDSDGHVQVHSGPGASLELPVRDGDGGGGIGGGLAGVRRTRAGEDLEVEMVGPRASIEAPSQGPGQVQVGQADDWHAAIVLSERGLAPSAERHADQRGTWRPAAATRDTPEAAREALPVTVQLGLVTTTAPYDHA